MSKSDVHDNNPMLARYQRAQQLEQGVFTKRVAFNTNVSPHWIGGSDCFWYVRETRDGQHYRLVDAKSGSNRPAFDHRALAAALQAASGEPQMADNLALTSLDFTQAQRVRFSALGKQWCFEQDSQCCTAENVVPQNWKVSPDGCKAVFTRDYNLWLRDLITGEERALTSDGDSCYVYAGTATVYGRPEMPALEALWSDDSRRIMTLVVNTREVNVGPPVVQHVPVDGSLRARIINPQRKVAFPEDEHHEVYRFLCIEVDSGKKQWADTPPSPVTYPPYAGYFTSRRGWWAADSRRAYLVDVKRGGKQAQLLEFDTHTGAIRVLIEEQSDHYVSFIPGTHIYTLLLPVPDTEELIWYSQRSGWAHLYLYDLASGRLKKNLTNGDWLVRNVLHLDVQRRELWLQTAGREPGRNPYYCDICRVNLDTGEFTQVRATDHDYLIYDHCSRVSQGDKSAQGVAPSGNYVVTTRSRVDQVPLSIVLDRKGNEVMILETADISGLPDNWQWPEPVKLTAADGETATYGVVFRPSDFSAEKCYPVLDCSYGAGPIGSFSNNTTGGWHYLSPAAYAELGFIVVMIFNRGNDAGLRGHAFESYQDQQLPYHPMTSTKTHKADCVAGIQQLANRYPYMDLGRVGVADFTSAPMALSGLLIHPDFYHVGVSINPRADWRLLGSMGLTAADYPNFEDFAGNLKGKLLLISGMLDEVMPVSMTLRVVDALIRANKSFDMLLPPNMGHDPDGYCVRRSWDYFVEHLLDAEPPPDFELTTGFDLLLKK